VLASLPLAKVIVRRADGLALRAVGIEILLRGYQRLGCWPAANGHFWRKAALRRQPSASTAKIRAIRFVIFACRLDSGAEPGSGRSSPATM